MLSLLRELDKWIRRRLRCYAWKQWGPRGYRELRKRGVSVRDAPPWQAIAQAYELIDLSSKWLESGRHICLGVARVDGGGLIGTCTLYDIDSTNLRAEVGFVLGAFAWRQGFMTEALTAVLEHAFDTLGLNRNEADTDPQNHAAIKLLEGLGFHREGLLRERWLTNGRKSDAAFYGLLRHDWRRRAIEPTTSAASQETPSK